MIINITNRKGNKLQLTGDLLTGDTYPMRDYIKSYMDGKWVADQKAWRVNIEKINNLIAQSVLRIDDMVLGAETVSPKAHKGMTYADFRRSADDPNSDF